MKLDILAIASHPDDVELTCSGTLALHVQEGYKVGIVDLTRGEMGTRGTPEQRLKEANQSSDLLGLAIRENLGLADVWFQNGRHEQLAVVRAIRKYRPEIIITNAISDRHPDHGRAAQLVKEAVFLSGLSRIYTDDAGESQTAHRPGALYHFIQNDYLEPDFIVDISNFWELKLRSILAFKSQFHNPESGEPDTFISRPEFLDFIEARARVLGHRIGATFGEGFLGNRTIGVSNLFHLK
jgi:bacillithiol biosynthesis deacetylase BshB1